MDDKEFDEVLLQKVAALFCEGLSKSDIASILSISETEVQRMIEHAEARGYFTYGPKLEIDTLLPEVSDFVSSERLTEALRAALKETFELSLINIRITLSPKSMFTHYVAPSPGSSEHAEYRKAEYLSLKAAAARASEELVSRLFDGEDHTIGVNWGISVKLTIDQMRPLPSLVGDATISVISLFGDLDFHAPADSAGRIGSEYINCNTHVQQLALRLGRRAKAVPLNVPGFIPAEFDKSPQTFSSIRNFLGSHSSYRRIFGELPGNDPAKPRTYNGIIDFVSNAEITRMDSIITGFGSADAYTDLYYFLQSWLDNEEIETLLNYSREGQVVGDIAGHLVPSLIGEHDDQVKVFLRHINRRILAAQPSDFVDVASRHRKTKKGAGVVGVTVGARKAKIVARLLSQSPCPISALFIDTHCALALLAELSPSEFRRFVLGPGRRLLAEGGKWSTECRRLIPIEESIPAKITSPN
jgi:DNA-binding transcriptional regulator LsrR (DeoR family)